MRDTEGALRWIVAILEKRNIPFWISGGFAAHLYGANREISDIDIMVPNEHLAEIASDTKPYVKFGPAKYNGNNWRLELLTLEYRGQEIDIGGYGNVQIQQRSSGKWFPLETDLSKASKLEAFGLAVPVIPKEKLMAYKKIIDREVDRADVKALS